MAHISKTFTPVPVSDAINEIKSNYGKSFIWFVVVNKTGSIFEIGGTNKSMKMYIPNYNADGSVKSHPNDFIYHNFEIGCGDVYVHPHDGINLEIKKFINAANNTNFHKVSFTPGHSGEIIYTSGKPAKIIGLK